MTNLSTIAGSACLAAISIMYAAYAYSTLSDVYAYGDTAMKIGMTALMAVPPTFVAWVMSEATTAKEDS